MCALGSSSYLCAQGHIEYLVLCKLDPGCGCDSTCNKEVVKCCHSYTTQCCIQCIFACAWCVWGGEGENNHHALATAIKYLIQIVQPPIAGEEGHVR